VTDELEPFPSSERIQSSLARMEARLPERFAELIGRVHLRPVEVTVDTTPPEITFADSDPATMSRMKPTLDYRSMERPARTEDDLETTTPQFFLRNTDRVERDADADRLDIEYRPLRDLSFSELIAEAHQAGGRRVSPLEIDLGAYFFALAVAERRVLVVDTAWHDVFGRPDPVD